MLYRAATVATACCCSMTLLQSAPSQRWWSTQHLFPASARTKVGNLATLGALFSIPASVEALQQQQQKQHQSPLEVLLSIPERKGKGLWKCFSAFQIQK